LISAHSLNVQNKPYSHANTTAENSIIKLQAFVFAAIVVNNTTIAFMQRFPFTTRGCKMELTGLQMRSDLELLHGGCKSHFLRSAQEEICYFDFSLCLFWRNFILKYSIFYRDRIPVIITTRGRVLTI